MIYETGRFHQMYYRVLLKRYARQVQMSIRINENPRKKFLGGDFGLVFKSNSTTPMTLNSHWRYEVAEGPELHGPDLLHGPFVALTRF